MTSLLILNNYHLLAGAAATGLIATERPTARTAGPTRRTAVLRRLITPCWINSLLVAAGQSLSYYSSCSKRSVRDTALA